jgi:hypothetical protein
MSLEVHVERTYSRISHNFSIINRLSEMLNVNVMQVKGKGIDGWELKNNLKSNT